MEALVEDLLCYSAIRAGKLALNREHVDLAAVCRLAAEEQMFIARRKVSVEASGELALALVDPRLLQQVVSNLLSNALKYSSPDRPVVLRLRIADGQAIISVHDEGPGIPAEALPHLFEQFYRAPQVEVQSGPKTSLGLGLAISHAIVKSHGGRIEVDSAIGRGSTFSVYLPLSAGHAITTPRPS
jgi:signal transduction histidine kinase